MKDYLQPNIYRFSQDSIGLAKRAAVDISKDKKIKVLDVCAGSGVVGLEFIKITNSIVNSICFIEKQKEVFEKYILENTESLSIHKKIVFDDFRNITLEDKFDVVLCNPPYFSRSKNRLSDNVISRNCTHFDDGFYESLITFILKYKKSSGMAYVLYRANEINSSILKSFKTEDLDNKTSILIL